MDHCGSTRRAQSGALCGVILLAMCAYATVTSAAEVRVGTAPEDGSLIISIDDASGLEGGELSLSYAPGLGELSSKVIRSELTANCLTVSNSAEPGAILIAFACLQPLAGSGRLAAIELPGLPFEASQFEVTGCSLNEGTMPCTATVE